MHVVMYADRSQSLFYFIPQEADCDWHSEAGPAAYSKIVSRKLRHINMFVKVPLHLHVSPQVKGEAIERHPGCALRGLRSHKTVKLCWSPTTTYWR